VEAIDIINFVTENKFWILLGFTALEKIVKKSPAEWDDVLFDMILDPIKLSIKKMITGTPKEPTKKVGKK